MDSKHRRLFLDSSVLISGAVSERGGSAVLLDLIETKLFNLTAVVPKQVLEECEKNIVKKIPRALPHYKNIPTAISPQIIPDPSKEEVAKYTEFVVPKDAPSWPPRSKASLIF